MKKIVTLSFGILLMFFISMSANAQVKSRTERKKIKATERANRKALLSEERNNKKYQKEQVQESRMEGNKTAVKQEKNAIKEEQAIKKRQKKSSKKDAAY